MRPIRFSVANLLFLTVIAALLGRVLLDRAQMTNMRHELRLHDSVARLRSVVANGRTKVQSLKQQMQLEMKLGVDSQSPFQWLEITLQGSEKPFGKSEVAPPGVGTRRGLLQLRKAAVRLELENTRLETQEKELRAASAYRAHQKED